MEALLTSLSAVVTSVFGWVGTVASTIVGTPLLLLTTGFLVLGKPHTAESKLGNIGRTLFGDNTEINYQIA